MSAKMVVLDHISGSCNRLIICDGREGDSQQTLNSGLYINTISVFCIKVNFSQGEGDHFSLKWQHGTKYKDESGKRILRDHQNGKLEWSLGIRKQDRLSRNESRVWLGRTRGLNMMKGMVTNGKK